MTIGYRGTLALLVLPFAAYVVAETSAAYRPITGASVPKGEPLPPTEDFIKGRERTARITAGAGIVAHLAFTSAAEEPAEILPDDMRKLARGLSERDQVWESVRSFLSEPKGTKYKGPLAKDFEAATR